MGACGASSEDLQQRVAALMRENISLTNHIKSLQQNSKTDAPGGVPVSAVERSVAWCLRDELERVKKEKECAERERDELRLRVELAEHEGNVNAAADALQRGKGCVPRAPENGGDHCLKLPSSTRKMNIRDRRHAMQEASATGVIPARSGMTSVEPGGVQRVVVGFCPPAPIWKGQPPGPAQCTMPGEDTLKRATATTITTTSSSSSSSPSLPPPAATVQAAPPEGGSSLKCFLNCVQSKARFAIDLYGILTRLGVETIRDCTHLTEEDLTNSGLPPIKARKVLLLIQDELKGGRSTSHPKVPAPHVMPTPPADTMATPRGSDRMQHPSSSTVAYAHRQRSSLPAVGTPTIVAHASQAASSPPSPLAAAWRGGGAGIGTPQVRHLPFPSAFPSPPPAAAVPSPPREPSPPRIDSPPLLPAQHDPTPAKHPSVIPLWSERSCADQKSSGSISIPCAPAKPAFQCPPYNSCIPCTPRKISLEAMHVRNSVPFNI